MQEALIRNLIDWTQTAPNPLQSYAAGLLASAMEIQDIAVIFKDSNATLVTVSYLHLVAFLYYVAVPLRVCIMQWWTSYSLSSLHPSVCLSVAYGAINPEGKVVVTSYSVEIFPLHVSPLFADGKIKCGGQGHREPSVI